MLLFVFISYIVPHSLVHIFFSVSPRILYQCWFTISLWTEWWYLTWVNFFMLLVFKSQVVVWSGSYIIKNLFPNTIKKNNKVAVCLLCEVLDIGVYCLYYFCYFMTSTWCERKSLRFQLLAKCKVTKTHDFYSNSCFRIFFFCIQWLFVLNANWGLVKYSYWCVLCCTQGSTWDYK